MTPPLYPLLFTEDSGICGAIAYISEGVELTDLHLRLIIDARNMVVEGTLNGERMKGWDPQKYW